MAGKKSPKRQDDRTTFVIYFFGYQNGNWQGNLNWIDKDKTQSFRSLLEMVKLMDCSRQIPK